MATVNALLKRWKQVNPQRIAQKAFDKTAETYADLNAQQMFEGKDSKDDPITLDGSKRYAPFTIRVKREKGQPTDRITLRDTGAFYRGIVAKLNGDTITITSTDEKADKIQEQTGPLIFGLDQSRKKEFALGVYKEAYFDEVLKKLGK